MPLDKLVRTLSSDEMEARAIESNTHNPSFVKAIKMLGTESTDASKLSELSLPYRSRRKLTSMICGAGVEKKLKQCGLSKPRILRRRTDTIP